MKIKTTFLSPTWSGASTAKTFSLEQKKPTLVSSYSLGKKFKYKEVSFEGITGWYNVLDKCKDRNVFHISGAPIKNIPLVIPRKKEYFEDKGTQILILDADSWPVPDGYSIRDKESMGRTIRHILDEMGLGVLKEVHFCALLSSSFWSYKEFRGHIYFIIDKPFGIQKLHEWGLAYNSMNPRYKIDYTLFRQVQPDYVSRRICLGFNDPLKDELRLTLHCDTLHPHVDSGSLLRHVTNTLVKAGLYTAENIATGSNVKINTGPPIGDTWKDTLKLCGKEPHGINDPAHRACAQLVQEIGDLQVSHNLNHYTDKVFTLAWEAIVRHGTRGDKNDRNAYNRDKFRGYIQTALKKKFGKETDEKFKIIADTIVKVQAGESSSLLFDADVLDALRQVKTTNPGKWAYFRSKVKDELRGKVNISDIEKAMKTDEGKVDIVFMIDEVIKRFEWIQGTQDNCLYMKTISPDGGYNLIPLDGGAEANIYSMGLTLFGGSLPNNFEKSVLKVLYSRKNDEYVSPFKRAPVENRAYHTIDRMESKVYFNLGKSELGDMTTAVITADSIDIVPSSQTPVVWNTTDLIQRVECDNTDTFGELLTVSQKREFEIWDFLRLFRRYVTAIDDDNYIDMVAWAISTMANTGTAMILEICGDHQDGKSSTATFIKDLVDPSTSDTKDAADLHQGKYKTEDIVKVLRSRQVTIFDNLRNLKPQQQDMFCTVATGWRYSLRLYYTQLYMDLIVKKPVIFTCLAPVVTNVDLRSRSVTTEVHKSMRSIYEDVHESWKKDRPRLVWGAMNLLSEVLTEINRMRKADEDMNDRNLWIDCARFVIYKFMRPGISDSQARESIAKRKWLRDIEEATISSSTGILLAFFEDCQKLHDLAKKNFYTTDLFNVYDNWVNENAGKTVQVCGRGITVAPKYSKKTARAFGIQLSSARTDIEKATRWMLMSKRMPMGKMWDLIDKRSSIAN